MKRFVYTATGLHTASLPAPPQNEATLYRSIAVCGPNGTQLTNLANNTVPSAIGQTASGEGVSGFFVGGGLMINRALHYYSYAPARAH